MPPSLIIGSSYSLNRLTEAEREHLDKSPWVFTCNSFLSHWESAGFRPTVWAWGDNEIEQNIHGLNLELSVLAQDGLLQERIRHVFVCLGNLPTQAQQAVHNWGMPATFYRRGAPWLRNQPPADTLGADIYHYGSTLTNLLNFAHILNPDGEICLFGNEWGPGFGHFWEGRREDNPDPEFWQRVKSAMWQGLSDLHRRYGYRLVDCNRHEEPLPEKWRLPTSSLCGFPQSAS